MKRIATFLATLIAIVLLVLPTMAGAIKVYDNANVLSDGDEVTLAATATAWPFDSVIYTDNVDRQALKLMAGKHVTTPRTVVIAVSPSAKGTSVRFGSGTNVDSSLWETIAKTGDASFKDKKWRIGIEAIGFRSKLAVEQASAAVAPTTTTSRQPAPVVVHHKNAASTGAWIAIGLCVAFFFGIAVWMVRRQRRSATELKEAADKLSYEAGDIASKSIAMDERHEGALWSQAEGRANRRMASRPARSTPDVPRSSYAPPVPRYTSPAPAYSYTPPPAPIYSHHTTVIERGGGASDFAMGVLVADALHDSHAHVEHHHHHHDSTPSRHSDPPPPSSRRDYNMGGGDSDWNSAPEPSPPSAPSVFESSPEPSYDMGGGDSAWND